MQAAPMRMAEWNKTPYAGTTAKDTDGNLAKLMAKYGITEYSMSTGTGPSGRKGFGVQFVLHNIRYQIGFETLDVKGGHPDELMQQVKRAVYFHIKSLLETASVFVRPEEVMMPYMVTASGQTFYQAVKPRLAELQTTGLQALLAQ